MLPSREFFTNILSTASAKSSWVIFNLAKMIPPLFARFVSITLTPIDRCEAIPCSFRSQTESEFPFETNRKLFFVDFKFLHHRILVNGFAQRELERPWRSVCQWSLARRCVSLSFGASSSAVLNVFNGRLGSGRIHTVALYAWWTASCGIPMQSILKYSRVFFQGNVFPYPAGIFGSPSKIVGSKPSRVIACFTTSTSIPAFNTRK